MPITDETLVMIATEAMLATHRFPTTNEKWEELGPWGKWKEMYKKSEKQSRVKSQDIGGQDQFGGSVIEERAGVAVTPGGRGIHVTIDELEGCFDSLSTSASTGKTTLDELVKTNTTLTSSIAELAAMNTRLTKEVASLSQEVKK